MNLSTNALTVFMYLLGSGLLGAGFLTTEQAFYTAGGFLIFFAILRS